MEISKDEQRILDLLSEAHNIYISMDKKVNRNSDWIFYMHGLQHLIEHNILVREIPDKFV